MLVMSAHKAHSLPSMTLPILFSHSSGRTYFVSFCHLSGLHTCLSGIRSPLLPLAYAKSIMSDLRPDVLLFAFMRPSIGLSEHLHARMELATLTKGVLHTNTHTGRLLADYWPTDELKF